MSKDFSRAEVAKHNKDDDCWVIIDNKVYDVTRFAPLHPGGERLLKEYGGQDVTEDFFGLHRLEVLEKYESKLCIGKIEGTKDRKRESFGDVSTVPYAEPYFWQHKPSPYYNDSHIRYRANLRKFIRDEVVEYAEDIETNHKQVDLAFREKLGQFGIYAATIGPGDHWDYVPDLPILTGANMQPKDFDMFHEMITLEELARCQCPGFSDGIIGGRNISVPTLLNFGFPHNEEMRKSIVKGALLGSIGTCLAITEPFVGSDVASLRTRGEKITENGEDFYVINGVKKWITEGRHCRYFITAFRTGGKGAGGVSLIIIDRERFKKNSRGEEAIQTKQIKTSYSSGAATSYIIFEDVKVPAKNLLCPENQGFPAVMHNFNQERWGICVGNVARCRVMVKECFQWAQQRTVFGKKLISQPVIQDKLAEMVSRVESCYTWLELLTYQMKRLSFDEANMKLGGDIALLKYQSAKAAHVVATEAVQIFGGRALTREGMGKYVERFQRSYRLGGVYGGSTEIMGGLAIRQALKLVKVPAKL
eukprot:maker-scaffold_16-snap-gene-0.41-mRNA-1 protein AED:0.02 eAED:0.02 QI:82/1/1/1/1/1/3/45/532